MSVENYRILSPLPEALRAGGQSMLTVRGEWKRYQELFEVLDHRPHPTRGSHIAATRLGYHNRRGADTSSVAFFLGGFISYHDVFRGFNSKGHRNIIRFYEGMTSYQPNADIYVSREESLRIQNLPPEKLGHIHKYQLSNGIEATEINPNGETIGFAGVMIVDKSNMPSAQENRGLVSARQKAAKGRVVNKSNEFIVEMSENDYRRLIKPEEIIYQDFERLTPSQKLVHISRTLRFNNAFPDSQVGRYPLALRLPPEALNQLATILASITPEEIKEIDSFEASIVASELMCAFLYHPETTARLLERSHSHLFPYLNRENISTGSIYTQFGRMMNSIVYHDGDPSQQIELSKPVKSLATPEAIAIATGVNAQLENKCRGRFDVYQHGLTWKMSDDYTAYLILPLVFSPIKLESITIG